MTPQACIKYPPFIKNYFKNSEVHIIGSGPSLIGFDYSKLAGKRIITINHSYKLVKSEFTVFVDKDFKREDPEIINQVTLSRADCDPPPTVGFNFAKDFSLNPENGVYPRYNKNSGISAVCIALQGGAEKVFIYGFDYRFFNSDQARCIAEYNGTELKDDRQTWAHSTSGKFNHTRETANIEETFRNVIPLFKVFPADKIFNMSPFSAVPYFEKIPLSDKYQKYFN